MSGIEIGNLESLHTLVFSSLEFLFRYLPLFLILFYAVPKRFRMFVLFAFSLILYALGDPAHVLILLGMSVVNWLFGYGLATEPDADGKRMSGLHRKNITAVTFPSFTQISNGFKYNSRIDCSFAHVQIITQRFVSCSFIAKCFIYA